MQEAFRAVSSRRRQINPNSGFMRQLERYERELRGQGQGKEELVRSRESHREGYYQRPSSSYKHSDHHHSSTGYKQTDHHSSTYKHSEHNQLNLTSYKPARDYDKYYNR